MRVEHEAAVGPEMHALPELIGLVDADLIDVDHPGVTAGAIADEARRHRRGQADAQVEPLADGGFTFDQPHIGMDLAQMPVAHASGPLIGVELLAHPAQEPDLVQPRAVAHLDREGARADLGEERPTIALLHGVEEVRRSAIRRVNTSMRPIELFGLAKAAMVARKFSCSISGTR